MAAADSTRATAEPSVEDALKNFEALSLSIVTVAKDASVSGKLADLIVAFPPDVEFQPDNELQGVPIRVLPDEVIALILRHLDHTSIERFATVSRKARLLSLHSGIWR